MHLTQFSDYSLRLMMFTCAHDGRQVTIEEVSKFYGISRAHLMKVANLMTRAGFLKAVRGRSGGLIMGRPSSEIRLSEIVRATEPDFALVECFGKGNKCVISGRCKLKCILHEALNAFIERLEHYSLADLMLNPQDFQVTPKP